MSRLDVGLLRIPLENSAFRDMHGVSPPGKLLLLGPVQFFRLRMSRKKGCRSAGIDRIVRQVAKFEDAEQACHCPRSSWWNLLCVPRCVVLLGGPALVPITRLWGCLLDDVAVAVGNLRGLRRSDIPHSVRCIFRTQAR